METPDQIRRALEQLPLWTRITLEDWLHELNERQSRSSRVEEARAAHASGDPLFMTLEEFLDFEETSLERHEFINGLVYAMTGGSLDHARITQNLTLALGRHLKGSPCEVFASNVRVVIERNADEIVYYPDVIVDCRPDTREPAHVRDPRVIIEVLSPSTHRVDRREKLQNYRLIDTLEEFVLVAQTERRVTIHRRAESWRPCVHAALDAAAEFRSIELAMPLTEIYDRVREAP